MQSIQKIAKQILNQLFKKGDILLVNYGMNVGQGYFLIDEIKEKDDRIIYEGNVYSTLQGAKNKNDIDQFWHIEVFQDNLLKIHAKKI